MGWVSFRRDTDAVPAPHYGHVARAGLAVSSTIGRAGWHCVGDMREFVVTGANRHWFWTEVEAELSAGPFDSAELAYRSALSALG